MSPFLFWIFVLMMLFFGANIAENIFKNYVNIISKTEADIAVPQAMATVAT